MAIADRGDYVEGAGLMGWQELDGTWHVLDPESPNFDGRFPEDWELLSSPAFSYRAMNPDGEWEYFTGHAGDLAPDMTIGDLIDDEAGRYGLELA